MQRLNTARFARLAAVAAACLISGPAGVAVAASAHPAAAVKAPAKTLRWSARGNRTLGTIKLTGDSVVRWTVTSGSFSVRDASSKLKGSGTGKTGETFVARGSYRQVKVRATGTWTLTITPLPASHH